MDFEIRRYTLILRRWGLFLIATVGCGALVSWLVATQNSGQGSQAGYEVAPWLVVLIVTVGGLIWGLTGIFGIEFLIDNIKTAEEVSRITPAPMLATVEAGWGGNGATPFALFDGDQTDQAGAYFGAEHSLLSLGRQGGGRSVLVCSPESTSFAGAAGANLAAASALSGHPTLLIDADRFEGSLSKSLGLTTQEGFTDALANPNGDVMLHLVPSVPNLYVLPAGRTPISNHTPFTRAHLRHLVERSGARASLVVIAGPPVGAENYGLGPGLAAAVDDVVLLAVADETKRRSMRRSVGTLGAVGANLTGVVFVRHSGPAFLRALRPGGSGSGAHTGTRNSREKANASTRDNRPPATARGAQPAARAAAAAVPQGPGFWEQFLEVAAKWVAITVARFKRPEVPKTQAAPRRVAEMPEQGLWARLQLAVARRVHAYATRRAEVQAPTRRGKQTTPLDDRGGGARTALELPSTAGASGQDMVSQWLKEADRERRRGNTAAAKALIERALDRDPRNEQAWQLRLLLSDARPGLPPIERQQEPPARRTSRLLPAILVAVPVVLLVAAVGFAWPQLSRLVKAQGVTPPARPTATAVVAAPVTTSSPSQLFTETGIRVGEPFLSFWKSHSGATVFGLPISPLRTTQTQDGRSLDVQYFERARFELHPGDKGGPAQVVLGNVGLEVPHTGTPAFPLPKGLDSGVVHFQVGQSIIDVPEKFNAFWKSNGGLAIFGNPITPVLIDSTGGAADAGLAVQYFERARFEYHADQPAGSEIELSRLGVLLYKK